MSLSALAAVSAGKSILKVTMAGGAVLAVCSATAAALPWWQQGVARWIMRSYAVDWCFLTVATTTMWGATEEAGDGPGEERNVGSIVGGAAGGGIAAYLGTLAFVALL